MSGEVILRRPASPLIFPGRTPGVDFNHLAVRGGKIRLTAIATNGNFVNLLNGKVGTLASTPLAPLNGLAGPLTGQSSGPGAITITTGEAVTDTSWTIATIANFVAGGGNTLQFHSSSNESSGGHGIQVQNPSGFFSVVAGVGVTSPTTNIPLHNAGPHFLGVTRYGGSGTGPSTIGWALNLQTGQLKFTSVWNDFGYAELVSDGTFKLLPGTLGAGSGVAAVMFSNVGLSIADITAWAKDPWSFWYPQRKATYAYAPPVGENAISRGGGGVLPRRVRSSPLAYPAGRLPGIDRNHPLGVPNFSAVALTPGNLTNLVNCKPGVLNGGPTFTSRIYPSGPGVEVDNQAAIQFPNCPAISGPSVTFAAIVVANSQPGNKCLLDTDGQGAFAGDGWAWRTSTGFMNVCVKPSFSSVGPSFTYGANVPYLLIASVNASGSNFLKLNLLTGVMEAESAGGLTPPLNPNGTVTVGNFGNSGVFGPDHTYHAIMWSPKFTTIAEMKAAASDPWSFWYPKQSKPDYFHVPQYLQDHPPGGFSLGLPLRRLRSPMQYPGARPGFDATHVAARSSIVVSAAVLGNGRYVALGPTIGGQVATIGAGGVGKIDGAIGPAISTAAGNAGSTLTWPATPSTPTSQVWGAICKIPTSIGSGWSLDLSAFAGNKLQLLEATGAYNLRISGGNVVTGSLDFSAYAGQPFFFAASVPKTGSNQVKFVAVNLLTGQIFTEAPSSSFIFGTPSSGTFSATTPPVTGGAGVGSATMTSFAVVSAQELLAWAKDPWSFWYPRRDFVFGTNPDPATGGIFSQIVSATIAKTVSVAKSVGKIASIASTGAVSLIKSVAKRIVTACTSSTIAQAIKVLLVTVSASCASTVTRIKSVGKLVPVASSGAVSFLKSCSKSVLAACSGAVSIIKSVGKRVILACTSSTIAQAIKVFLVTVSASCSSTVTRIKSIAKLVLPSAAGTVTTRKAVTHTVSSAASSVASFAKSVAKPFITACTSTVSIVRQFIANGAGFVYNVTISVHSSTIVQWLINRFRPRNHIVATPRVEENESLPRHDQWPANPR
jgi:hypothetical protein